MLPVFLYLGLVPKIVLQLLQAFHIVWFIKAIRHCTYDFVLNIMATNKYSRVIIH